MCLVAQLWSVSPLTFHFLTQLGCPVLLSPSQLFVMWSALTPLSVSLLHPFLTEKEHLGTELDSKCLLSPSI